MPIYVSGVNYYFISNHKKYLAKILWPSFTFRKISTANLPFLWRKLPTELGSVQCVVKNSAPLADGAKLTASKSIHNARSCLSQKRAVLIHDVIADNRLEVLANTETWIPSDVPDAVSMDIAPPGFSVIHAHRGTSSDKGGAS